jgi:hypothetical protein
MNDRNRDRIYDMIEAGSLDWESFGEMALRYMTDADVGWLISLNELNVMDDDDDE